MIGVTLVLDKLRFKADKKLDGSIGLVQFFLTAMLRLIARKMGDKWFDSEETLFTCSSNVSITRKNKVDFIAEKVAMKTI